MPKTRTRPTREDTAAQLLEGARVVFAQKGFHGARLEDICASAGLTRGAFYSGFDSRDALFLALYDRMIEEVRALIGEALARGGRQADGSIEAFVAYLADHYPLGREWYLLNAEFTLYAIRNENVRDDFADRRRTLRGLIVEAIATVLAAAGRTLTVDADLFARLLVALFDAGLGQSLVEPDRLAKTAFVDTFLTGLIGSCSVPVCSDTDNDRRVAR